MGPRTLRFPADHGAHPETRIEWWYVTGWLQPSTAPAQPQPQLQSQPAYGFQLTFFRSPTSVAADHPSRFAARQLILAHAAVSDVAARKLHHDQRAARAVLDIAGAALGDTNAWLRDWRLSREQGANGSGRYRARCTSAEAGFAIDLALATTQPLLLQGDAGLSRKGPSPEQASHYYSQPQLEASGRITVAGRALDVTGRAWLDHEWSDSVLATDAVGWDWMGMNLHDGSALTAFRLRRADGRRVYTGGSWRPAGGAVRSFAASEVGFTPRRRWTSPHTAAVYPVTWEVATPAGRYSVEAVFDDQELDSRRSTGAVYWEGLSALRDEQGRVVGHGYLEMTGYAERLRL